MGDLGYAARVIEDFLEGEAEPELTSTDVAEMQSVLVSVYFEAGDIHLAERAASRALAAINKHTPPQTQAEAYWHAARLLAERHRWEEALELTTRARFLMERIQSRRELARLRVALAWLCLEMDPPRADEAETNLNGAAELLADLGMPAELGNVYVERGRAAFILGHFDQAIEHTSRVLNIDGVEDAVRARAFFVQGRALVQLERYEDARNALRQAISMYEAQGANRHLASCWRELGKIDEAEGNLTEAVSAYHSALDALEPFSIGP
jgi:tetratricopeptide (TPR) repeat protein